MLFTSQRRDAVMEREMAYTADVNRWRGPAEENYEPHMLESPWHPRLDCRDRGWVSIIWWPIGLALLFFTLGSRKWVVGVITTAGPIRWSRMQYKMERNARPHGASRLRFRRPAGRAATAPSTNTAWKPCGAWRKSRTEFRDFLDRLRHAKDKEEFDQFMAQHRTRPTPPPSERSAPGVSLGNIGARASGVMRHPA